MAVAITAQADSVFTDSFDRMDDALGANWNIIWGTPQIAGDGVIAGSANMADSELTGLGTVVMAIADKLVIKDTFKLSFDVAPNGQNIGVGLIMNYTAKDSFYVLRQATASGDIQLGKLAGGTEVKYRFHPAGSEFTYSTDETYRFTVESPSPGTFNFTVGTLSGETETIIYSGSWTDSEEVLTGGHAGFYLLTPGTRPTLDNFSVSTAPEE